jgi:carbon monoxide dehydrogenase subunit G
VKFQNSCVIGAPSEKLWAFLTAIPEVAGCMPGVEEVKAVEEGKYVGIVTVKVGMVKLRLNGTIAIEFMDAERQTASMRVEAADQRISGMIQGKLTMSLAKLAPAETKLVVDTDLNLFGKIGEFGQPLIKRKADQMMAEFSANVVQKVAGGRGEDVARKGSVLGIA